MEVNRFDEIIDMLSGFIKIDEITNDDIDDFMEYIHNIFYVVTMEQICYEKPYHNFLRIFFLPSEIVKRCLALFYYRETGIADMQFVRDVVDINSNPEFQVTLGEIEFMILSKSLDVEY